MAIQDFYETLIFVEKKAVSDGMGGFIVTWADGAEFMGSITTDNSMEKRIAEQQGVTSLYTVTTNKNVPLKFNDVIKRKATNEIYRITGDINDVTTPRIANIQFSQVPAERFVLTE